jgi:hypothetical protein
MIKREQHSQHVLRLKTFHRERRSASPDGSPVAVFMETDGFLLSLAKHRLCFPECVARTPFFPSSRSLLSRPLVCGPTCLGSAPPLLAISRRRSGLMAASSRGRLLTASLQPGQQH